MVAIEDREFKIGDKVVIQIDSLGNELEGTVMEYTATGRMLIQGDGGEDDYWIGEEHHCRLIVSAE